uniref:Uncharacterized protein n=1 Tax=Ascaris lumbricoides TaxID=6252 RepID=A0A0M3HSE4_ASCLU
MLSLQIFPSGSFHAQAKDLYLRNETHLATDSRSSIFFRRHITNLANSVRRLIRSPSSFESRSSASRIFFWPSKIRKETTSSSSIVQTPDSARSVFFEIAVEWPFIDDEISELF